MEAFYMQLMVNQLRAKAALEREHRGHHSGVYDREHSPEHFLITEDDWCNAASLPKPKDN